MFDILQLPGDMAREVETICALAYICRQSLADLNARAWMASAERERLSVNITQQIKANHIAYKDSLHWAMENSKTFIGLSKVDKKG